MNKISLKNKKAGFEAALLRATKPTHTVLFAAGSGGNPERHLPLLNSLVECGCTVIAPYFERIVSPMPSSEELVLRADSLQASLDFIGNSNSPIVGVGHSIGATLLIALGGGQMWMRSGQCLSIAQSERLKKLVLLAPPSGFFQTSKSLDAVQASIQVWVGSLDTITAPQQVEYLKCGMPAHVSLDFRVVEGAGHFSFMNTLPPNIVDSMENREQFLSRFASDVCQFVLS